MPDYPRRTWSGNLEARTVLGYSWGCPTSSISVRRSVMAGLRIPEDVFRYAADHFLMSVLPLVTEVGFVQTPASTCV